MECLEFIWKTMICWFACHTVLTICSISCHVKFFSFIYSGKWRFEKNHDSRHHIIKYVCVCVTIYPIIVKRHILWKILRISPEELNEKNYCFLLDNEARAKKKEFGSWLFSLFLFLFHSLHDRNMIDNSFESFSS